MKRRSIATFGGRGSRVRVFVETTAAGSSLVRMEYRRAGRKTLESWPNTKQNRAAAKAMAKALALRLSSLSAVPMRITVGDLWKKYLTSKALAWRASSRPSAEHRWRSFAIVTGEATYAEQITAEVVDTWRARLKALGRAPNQIRAATQLVKSVWRFALARKLISENPLADYNNSFAAGEGALDVPEYTPEEFAKIVRHYTYRDSRQWRQWVALVLAGTLGPRQNALLNLAVADVDLAARTVTWRKEHDKRGVTRVQPLPRGAVFAFRVAAVWRRRMNYSGRFVLPAVSFRGRRDAHYTYQALQNALVRACEAKGIPWVRYRAMHGFRRMVVTTLNAETGGDLIAAGKFVGDTDVRTLRRSYLKNRAGELVPLAVKIDAALPQKPTRSPRPTMKTGREVATEWRRKPHQSEGGAVSHASTIINEEPQVGIEPTTASFRAIGDKGQNPGVREETSGETQSGTRETAPNGWRKPRRFGDGVATRRAFHEEHRRFRRRYRESPRGHRRRLAGSGR